MAFCYLTPLSEVRILNGPAVELGTVLIPINKDSFKIDTAFGTATYYVNEYVDDYKYCRYQSFRYAIFKYFDIWGN